MGMRLAKETGVEADVIVPVPDSGVPAAMGYALQSGIPYELGIIRSHYAGRTFIQPKQEIRARRAPGHAANRAVIKGKRVVLVDDSIVRGTTSQKIVQMVKEAGAKEVHFRSASPPIMHPDFYGIDMPSQDQLMAAQMTLEEMRKTLSVDTLGFLSVDGLYWAMGEKKRNAENPTHRPPPPATIQRRCSITPATASEGLPTLVAEENGGGIPPLRHDYAPLARFDAQDHISGAAVSMRLSIYLTLRARWTCSARRRMRFISALLAIGLATAAQASTISDSIDAFIAAELPDTGAPGIAYAVVDGGETFPARYGEVLRRGRAVTPDTPFWIGPRASPPWL
ncbi:MAG: phosphoribosyltransferase family protein [Hyphomonadaceae bacterium]